MPNSEQQKDLYFVATKVFLLDDKGRLLILRDVYDDGWDLPGGRLREMDFETPLGDVVKRKMKEEVGEGVAYDLEEPAVFMRHERVDANPTPGKEGCQRIFAIGYRAQYQGGDIQLGEYFKEYKWVDLKNFTPEEYFLGGWLKGVKEFQKKILGKV